MSRKLDDKELEDVTGGADVFAPNPDLIDPSKLKMPPAGEDPVPDPIGGGIVPTRDGGDNTGIGDGSGSGTFDQG
jgi:hypothetical protein